MAKSSTPTTTSTTTANPYFRDPESKPPARNQGSEPPSSVRAAPPPLSVCPSGHYLHKVFLTTLIPEMLAKNKYLWSNISGEKPHITCSFLEIHITITLCNGHHLVSPVSLALLESALPQPPFRVATQGAAVLFNVTGYTLGCSRLAHE